MAIAISVESPLQDEVRAMVADLNAYMMPLTPREFQFQLTGDEIADMQSIDDVKRVVTDKAGEAQ